jgi:hypothetical protein
MPRISRTKGLPVTKKPAKSSPSKTAKPVKAAKAKPAPAKAAAPADPSEKSVPAEAPVKAKAPPVPPRPVPPHQQFLSKGPKLQHMTKGRIFRHQGR